MKLSVTHNFFVDLNLIDWASRFNSVGKTVNEKWTWHRSPLHVCTCLTRLYASATFTSGNKQLLDEVFVISRVIKVEVMVISRSRRLRPITLTETILGITKTESNNCFIIHL